jgi:hypothetical protein
MKPETLVLTTVPIAVRMVLQGVAFEWVNISSNGRAFLEFSSLSVRGAFERCNLPVRTAVSGTTLYIVET